MTFYEHLLKNNIKSNADGPALVCDGIAYTYKELDAEIVNLVEKFKSIGIDTNDKVMFMHKNPCKYALILLAIIRIGAIPMPLYSKMGQLKLEEIINTYEPNYFIKSGDNNFIKLEESDMLHIVQPIEFFEIENEWINVEATQDKTKKHKNSELIVHRLSEKKDLSLELVKLILFSSGTTSAPKAIMLSQDNIFANIVSICDYLKPKMKDKILLIKDLSHSSSITSELFVGLYSGCEIVMTEKLPINKIILKLLESKRINILFAVPSLLKGIMTYPRLAEYDLSDLRIINFYGASMFYKDIVKLVNILPYSNIIYSYGQTEASPRVTYIEKEDLLKKSKSCGRAIRGVKVHIESKKGEIVGPNIVGEVIVKGPNVMLGYYKNQEKTAKTVIDGNLHTGDLGYMDEDGFLYITGRIDNMIISGGQNIYPEEIENVLISHESIYEALCVEKKKDNETSELIAYIVLKKGAIYDYKSIINHLKKNLELYKLPKDIIIVEELEKTPSGKIKRNVK